MLIIKFGGSVIQEELTHINPKVFTFIDKIISLKIPCAIVTGGGKVCRLYQNAVMEKHLGDKRNIHEIGIRALNLQAQFIKTLLPLVETYPDLIDSPEILDKAVNNMGVYKFFSCGSWGAGHSSDWASTVIAKDFGFKKILRVSNVDYVYDKDPRKFADAKSIKELSWDEYLDIIGNPTEHLPGTSYPVDPLAVQVAKENGLEMYFTSIDKFLEMENFSFDDFDGTVLS